MHNIRFWIVSLALLFTAVGCQPAGDEASADRPPNFVVFLADDQGWGDLSMNGNVNVSTPNVDRLAREGASFQYFYVSPVCSPTRAEFLTGRYHPRGGVYSTSAGGERLDLDETTIADLFKRAGYATGAFGKWHNGMQYPYHPNGRGFEEYYGFASGHWGNYFSPFLEHNGEIVQGNGYIINDFTDKAIAFIEEHRDRPFFAYLPYNTPHSPMQVPDEWWGKFADNDLEYRHREPELEDVQHSRAALAMTENIDWNVGRLMQRLDELGLTENTVVLYFTDNGPNGWRWNGGMKGRKGSTDEGGVRSPLLIKWPGQIEAGLEVEPVAAAIDLLPTLVDLAGIDGSVEKPLDGVSLKPLLQGGLVEERLLFSRWRDRTSVRSQRYRLDSEGRLFDMINDPGQQKDVASEQIEVVERLQSAKEIWETDVLGEIVEDERLFPVGHPDYKNTQLPARDAVPSGGIERSNRFPNDSFFSNWTSTEDTITWDVEVLADGEFEVELYYAVPASDVGSTVELSFNGSTLTGVVSEAHDPPLAGMENDRVERQESYIKEFKFMSLGRINLTKGAGQMTLRALDIPGSQVMEFRLMMLKRVQE